MDPHPPQDERQPQSNDDSTSAPAWPFNPAFTFSALGLAQNPFSMNGAEMATVFAPTMDPQFMNYQFDQMGYGNPQMAAPVESTTTFFTQNNGASAGGSSSFTMARAQGSHPSVLQFPMNPPHTAPPVAQESRLSLSTNKTPPPHVEFGKRSYIGLKIYQNGEAIIHRRVIRYGLEIYQQPVQGKTFAEKDRRAIVHPPVVRLWLVESQPTNPEMAGMAESLPYLLEDDTFWRDTLVDVTTLETAEYICIVDALLSPEDGTTTSMDDTPGLLPSGYRLANTVPTSAPSPSTQSQANITPPEVSTSNSSSSDAHPASGSSRRASTISKMIPTDETVSTDTSRRPSTDIRKASAQIPLSVSPESLFQDEPRAKRENSASPDDDEVSPMVVSSSPTKKRRTDSVVSASLAPTSKSSAASSQGTYKRNLLGNWAVGCRKMYGMGTPDDLGIWFVFNDISIQQPGKYALQFKCYNLNDTQTATAQKTPPYAVTNPVSTNPQEQDSKQEAADKMDVDVKPAPDSQRPPGLQTSTTPPPSSSAQALPLCTAQSADFTVHGMKGMPSWPHTTELTSHFIR